MKNNLTVIVAIRSIMFWLLFALTTLSYAVLSTLILPLNKKIKFNIIVTGADVTVWLLKNICGSKWNIQGKNNLNVPSAIITGNHQSTWETLTFNTIIHRSVPIMKSSILRIPFFGWALSAASPIAINRAKGSDALSQIIEQGNKRVNEDGLWIMAFPEGTRTPVGSRKGFKLGAAKLAININIPLIPIAHNAGKIMPRRSFWIYPGTVDIIIGKPIHPQRNQTAEELTKQLQDTVYTQLDSIGG